MHSIDSIDKKIAFHKARLNYLTRLRHRSFGEVAAPKAISNTAPQQTTTFTSKLKSFASNIYNDPKVQALAREQWEKGKQAAMITQPEVYYAMQAAETVADAGKGAGSKRRGRLIKR